MRITAAVTENKNAPFVLTPLELDDPGPGEVIVRMVGSGLCHTDLVVRDQRYPVPLPAVLGHEGSGVVDAVGRGVSYVAPGDHVVLTFNSCGGCRMCLRGRPSCCDRFAACNFGGARDSDGAPLRRDSGTVHGLFFGQSAFATHALATERNVVKVDRSVPLELLGPLGCSVQTGVGAVLNSLRPEAGSSIAVLGVGPVGMSAVMAAAITGCDPIVAVDLNEQRLALAMELGATHVVRAGEGRTVSCLRDLAGGLGTDYCLETTAVPTVLRQAVDALNHGGTCGVIGAPGDGVDASIDMSRILFGRTVRGISEGDSVPRVFIPELITLYQRGRLPFDRLIRTYDFANINQAVEDFEKGTTLKSVLTFA
ncbi:NAD(P)-dependent alcohol dehydrogenase [Streptomyces sp. NPDC091280]|uniref:NAD(P)-dependent alcohol dehydrogenase n=1 Tax=Streptomyces sp. NPDC091280 TaxID=3365984 RepID=UPI003812C95F